MESDTSELVRVDGLPLERTAEPVGDRAQVKVEFIEHGRTRICG
ncbi:hypothetical protein [Streptomyces sp. NPDC050528]